MPHNEACFTLSHNEFAAGFEIYVCAFIRFLLEKYTELSVKTIVIIPSRLKPRALPSQNLSKTYKSHARFLPNERMACITQQISLTTNATNKIDHM